MNKWLERALIFTGGAVIGSSVIYFGLKNKLENEYDDKLNLAIAKEEEAFREINKLNQFEREAKELNKAYGIDEKDIEEYDDICSLYDIEHEDTAPVTHYDKIDLDLDEGEDVVVEDPEEQVPYFISEDTFLNDATFDSSTIYHYDDGILAYKGGEKIYNNDPIIDENNAELDELEHLLGPYFRKKFVDGTLYDDCVDGEERVYIRNSNKNFERDYEIVRTYMWYKDDAYREDRRIGG